MRVGLLVENLRLLVLVALRDDFLTLSVTRAAIRQAKQTALSLEYLQRPDVWAFTKLAGDAPPVKVVRDQRHPQT